MTPLLWRSKAWSLFQDSLNTYDFFHTISFNIWSTFVFLLTASTSYRIPVYLTLILTWQPWHNRADVLIMSVQTIPVNYILTAGLLWETSITERALHFEKKNGGLHNVVFLFFSGSEFLLSEPVSWPSLELLWNQNCITVLILLSMIHAREKQYITKDNTMFYIKI